VAFGNIDAAELERLRESGPVTVVDVRTDAEVARGAIPGARHIPLQLLPQRLDELNPGDTIVIYCQSGARSAQACGWLAGKGFQDLHNLQGGLTAWVRDGRTLAPPPG
jgi:rhodanese-related sulfurtransferase